MSTQAQFEWQTTESEEEWARLSAAPTAHVPARTPSRRLLWEIALMLVVLAGAGGRWYMAYSRAQQQKAELQAAAVRDLQASANEQAADPSAAARIDPGDNSQAAPLVPQASGFDIDALEREAYANHDVVIHAFRVQRGSAVVYAMTPTSAYRQTLFYRRSEAGWQAAEPDPALWGAARSLATASFNFVYQEQDAAVVAAVAPQLEALYAQMRASFGLANPSPAKIVVEVSLAHNPGAGQMLLKSDGPPKPDNHSRLPRTHYQINVASPVRYVAPAEVQDAELLAQSIALPLALKVAGEAVRSYEWPAPGEMQLLQALYLWQVWDLDLPLAHWREEVAHWRVAELQSSDTAQAPTLPSRYVKLCAMHRLWLTSPREIGIPLTCAKQDRSAAYWATVPVASTREVAVLLRPVLRRTQTQEGEAYWLDWSGDAVALAVLLEFIADGYGRERLAVFVRELAHHTSPNTLILQVFGVSVAEFERAWQAYLAALAPKAR